MWRTPNVRRESGKYKVPITPEELMEMSAEDYQALCAQPRILPAPAEPVLSQKLAVLYAKAESKVEASAKKRKDSKKDFELLAKFKGEFPPSLAAVMAGTITPKVGFHSIALQVTITANALGKAKLPDQYTRGIPACRAEVRRRCPRPLSMSLSGRPTRASRLYRGSYQRCRALRPS
jgi:hypothetical protein